MKLLVSLLLVTVFIHQSFCQDCFGEGIPSSLQTAAVAKGADDFSMKLFTDIAVSYPHNSIVLSPFSVWSVLKVAYFGAQGNTETQLQKALGVPSKKDAFYSGRIIDAKLSLHEGTTFNKADKAYFADDIVLRQCAIDKLTEIERVNFNDAKTTADKINKDISDATKGKISKFLSAGIIKNSRFILINAVYFKGLWDSPFVVKRTTLKPFYDETSNIEVSEAKMMAVQSTFNYYNSKELNAAFIELPYENSNISMHVILPNIGKSGINNVLKSLSADVLKGIESQMTKKTVLVNMPRFKMTTRIADELKTGLQNLQILDLFEPTKIDLRSFIPSERVKIDDALHHATIEVTEEGTVAAAVTGLIGTRSGVANIVHFNANRPFIFLIRDVSQGVTLFMGVLRNPNHTTPF